VTVQRRGIDQDIFRGIGLAIGMDGEQTDGQAKPTCRALNEVTKYGLTNRTETNDSYAASAATPSRLNLATWRPEGRLR
jgi:hypothetical protein